jgi:CHASE2 domain-containing sensor protein
MTKLNEKTRRIISILIGICSFIVAGILLQVAPQGKLVSVIFALLIFTGFAILFAYWRRK